MRMTPARAKKSARKPRMAKMFEVYTIIGSSVIDMMAGDYFCPDEPGLFRPIYDSLFHQDGYSDYYLNLADYRSYISTQEAVSRLYLDPEEWTRRSILNTARMGKFSSDRSVLEYAANIWQVQQLLD